MAGKKPSASPGEARIRRTPPNDMSAEQAVLGGIFLRPERLDELDAELRPEDLYSPAHQAIYRAAQAVQGRSEPVDLVTVAAELKARGQLEQAGGPVYLAELGASPVSASNALYHARIVRDCSRRRALAEMGMGLAGAAYDPQSDPAEFASRAATVLDAALEGRLKTGPQSPKEFLSGYMKWLQGLQKQGGAGVPTPYYKLNSLLTGLWPGELVYVAGRPSNGKTVFGLNLVKHACQQDYRVGVVSIEMTRNLLLNRFAASWGVVAQRFRDGKFSDADWNKIYDAAGEINTWNLRVYDTPVVRASEIRAQCRRWKREMGGLDLVVVDYLQLVAPENQHAQRERQVAEASWLLKVTALELETCMVVLTQLGREAEKRGTPLLSDLRESGAQEQDADVILMIEPWDQTTTTENPAVKFIMGKGRNNTVGTFDLAFQRKFLRFANPPHERGER